MPPKTDPRQTQIAQIPVAEPTFSGATYLCTASGPQIAVNIRAMPSMARETISSMPLPQKAPNIEPTSMIAVAASSIGFGPNFLASAPVGMASTMPTKVKMDISQEAAPTSILSCSIISGMTEGTLY